MEKVNEAMSTIKDEIPNVDEQFECWLKSYEGSPLPLKWEHTGKPIAKIISIDTAAGTMTIEPIK